MQPQPPKVPALKTFLRKFSNLLGFLKSLSLPLRSLLKQGTQNGIL